MSDAPERIWLDTEACFGRAKAIVVGNAITKARDKAWDTDVEYIRFDVHEAAVAAARVEGMRDGLLDGLAQRTMDATDRYSQGYECGHPWCGHKCGSEPEASK